MCQKCLDSGTRAARAALDPLKRRAYEHGMEYWSRDPRFAINLLASCTDLLYEYVDVKDPSVTDERRDQLTQALCVLTAWGLSTREEQAIMVGRVLKEM